MAKLQLRVLTSDCVKVDEPVDMVIMRCLFEDMGKGKNSAVGDVGILPGHVPLSAVLGISSFRVLDLEEGTERRLAVHGGVVTVKDNVVTVLTERAEWPEDLERAHAEAMLAEIEREREALEDDTLLRQNQIAMRKALVRIEVSSYPLLGGKK